MVHSMTSFGRHGVDSGSGQWVCEIRTVNHRYLEQNIRLPEAVRAAEPLVRERVKNRLARGKVDVVVRRGGASSERRFEINHKLLNQLIREANEIVLQNPQVGQWNVSDLLAWPDILANASGSDEDLESVLSAVNGALERCVKHRAQEGAALQDFVTQRADGLLAVAKKLKVFVPVALEALRSSWRARLAGEGGINPERVEQEFVIQIQKWDIHEEIGRLEEHCQSIKRSLSGKEPVGRRLDFLAQELNREANTIASKSSQVEMTNLAVDMKVLIEQIREQVQNIE